MQKSYLQLHIAVLFLGLSPVLGKLITLNEGLLTWYRVAFSAIILFFVLRFSKVEKRLRFSEKVAIGSVGVLVALSWVFFFAGIKYSNISVGVVCYCIASFFTAVLEPLMTKTRFRLSQLLLSALTILGIALIFSFDTSYRLGIALGIISPLFYSLYSIYNKQLAGRYDSRLINYYQMVGGTIGLGVLLTIYLYIFPARQLIPDLRDSIYLMLLSAFCTVLVYVLLTQALKNISAFTANLSMNLEPIYAIIVAFIFFNESQQVNGSFYAGLFFVVLSVILQTVISVAGETK
ncbi:MAG TPA: DMT family transporter [Sphingobacterium sp.]|jgi:drug/metabolite transporter (DMT)-like permease|nr:DMT family transporter [Sphingobacterium sp.]